MDLSFGYGALGSLPKLRKCRARRASSYDRSGGNADYMLMKPGEAKCFAQLPGAGVIRHIWLGGGADEVHYHRKVLLRMYWDGEQTPSVEVPLGDFFGVGHGASGSFYSMPLSMYVADSPARPTRNCWFPMPFATHAKITIENDMPGDRVLGQLFFQIDFEKRASLPANTGRLHAQFRRQNPTVLTEDFVILDDVQGPGMFFGCVMGIRSLGPSWWGEGEVKFYIDGDTDYPTICGTGAEDYFLAAYGMYTFQMPYHGCTLNLTKHCFTYTCFLCCFIQAPTTILSQCL